MFSRFDTYRSVSDGQTDGRTHRQTYRIAQGATIRSLPEYRTPTVRVHGNMHLHLVQLATFLVRNSNLN